MIAARGEGEEGEKVNLKICLARELNPRQEHWPLYQEELIKNYRNISLNILCNSIFSILSPWGAYGLTLYFCNLNSYKSFHSLTSVIVNMLDMYNSSTQRSCTKYAELRAAIYLGNHSDQSQESRKEIQLYSCVQLQLQILFIFLEYYSRAIITQSLLTARASKVLQITGFLVVVVFVDFSRFY